MRYLTLILILSLASTANAFPSLYINGSPAPSSVELAVDEVLTVQIYSSDQSNWLGYLIMDEGGVGALSNAVTYNITPHPDGGCAGGQGSNVAYSYAGWGAGYEFTTAGVGSPTDVVAGTQHTADYSSSVTGTAYVGLYDDSYGEWPADELYITVVPEPCTVLLLGLGGLAVLKIRKR